MLVGVTGLACLLVAAACSDEDGDDRAEGAAATTTTASTTTTSATTTSTPPVTGSFTSLSYNVAGLPQGVNPDQDPELHQPLIAPLLNAYDVVLVQEDFGTYTEVLRAEAEHAHLSEPHPGPQVLNPIGRAEAVVGDGLNIHSRLPIGDLERVPWTGCGAASADCLALKGFAGTELSLAEGVAVDLYTLHVEAGGEDSALRGDDLDQLAAHLAERSPGAVVIGGDWNLEYADDPDGDQLRAFLAETGLEDVCDVLDCGADDDVIDRFLFRSDDVMTLTPMRHRFERETFVGPAGEPLSDHDPLAVDWSWST